MVYILAVLAALVVGAGSVIEQRAARQAPPEYNLSPRLLVWLAQRPRWLGGVACSLAGNLVFALALGVGSVVLVQAVFTVRLLFALVIAAAWGRHRVPGRDAIGGVAVAGGLAAFLLAAQPRRGTIPEVPAASWLIGGLSVVAFCVALAALGRRLGPARKALLLGTAAGGMFGLQSSLMHEAVAVIGRAGLPAVFATWLSYAVIVAALAGMLLVQSAYEAAPLPASYPAIVTVELLAGIALGIGLLGGRLTPDTTGFAVGVAGIGGMVAGIYLLTTSPIVTGQLDRLVRQQEVGRARIIETRLERELRRADRAMRRADRMGDGASHGRLQRELRVIEDGLDQLVRLQDDIATHRIAERDRLAGCGDGDELAAQERDLARREGRIDESAQRLREQARRLATRMSAATGQGR